MMRVIECVLATGADGVSSVFASREERRFAGLLAAPLGVVSRVRISYFPFPAMILPLFVPKSAALCALRTYIAPEWVRDTPLLAVKNQIVSVVCTLIWLRP